MKKGIDYIGVGIGAVIIDTDKKLFLSKRGKAARNEKGKWEFPGGALEFGDNFEDTIKREIKEEFDLEIDIIDSLEPYNYLDLKEKLHWVALCFVCKVTQGMAKIMEPEKCESIGWFTIEEIEKMDLATYSRHRLKQMIEKYPNGLPLIYT